MSDLNSNPTENSNAPETSGHLADPAALTPELFDAHVGDCFQVIRQQFEHPDTHINPLRTGTEGEEEIVELKLIEVTRYPKLKEIEGGWDHRAREPFSLLFEGPLEPTLISAQHTIMHQSLGNGRLFLNPVQVAARGSHGTVPEHRFYETPFG